MPSLIVPTITAYDPHDYRVQLQRIVPFARRIHVDFMDGIFASPKSISLVEAHWPKDKTVDLHIMYANPEKHLRVITALKPFTVIVHAEADGNFVAFAEALHERGIGVGLALLPETPVESILPALPMLEHVLVFSGKLGSNGGVADMNLLSKVHQLRKWRPDLEIGWDGGVNLSNVWRLTDNGVDILNVGGFIQHATNPAQAYATLESLTQA